jgi:hypothetical protein
MILHDTSCLKTFVINLDQQISLSKIQMKRARLYEILAKSQGFNTKAALVEKLPILLDISDVATKILFANIEKYGIKSEDFIFPNKSLLEDTALRAQRFPVVAAHGSLLKLSIDWDDGYISKPYLCHESNIYSKSWEEFYGNSTSYDLPFAVLEDEYYQLCDQIRPLVQRVVDGYTENGWEEHASFSEDADSALKEIHANISLFCFAEEGSGGVHPVDFYGDQTELEDIIEEHGLIEINTAGEFLLDYSYSDIDLRQLVASELSDACSLVNDESLFVFFKSLRDACQANYQEIPLYASDDAYD